MSQLVFENTIKDLLLVRHYRVEVYGSKGKVRRIKYKPNDID